MIDFNISRKIFFAGIIFFGVFQLKINSNLVVDWQRNTILEKENKVIINTNVPRIIISNNSILERKINKAITQDINYIRHDFISAVTTVAEDNEETNTLNIETEILLMTPRLISLAFTETHHLAGITDNDPETTFLIFDLLRGEPLLENNKLFHDDMAWSTAVQVIKAFVLSNYQGHPRCDLSFAPKNNGFAASCIGVDTSRRWEHLSIAEDIPIAMIQEFVVSSLLLDIIQ